MGTKLAYLAIALLCVAPSGYGQEPQRRMPMPPISLGPDDKSAVPAPPNGFDEPRNGIARGRAEMLEYDSKTVGTRRKVLVYTPPGYTEKREYPVLYLLHGIGGDETEWQRHGAPEAILDNLYADGKLVPMLVVMPNGRAQKNDRAEGDVFQTAPAFAVFERDLLDDLVPFVESRFPVTKDRLHRAIAGLSMGGGQSLNFGLGHLDTFAWVGAFSAAPNTKPPTELVPDPDEAKRKLKLLWISCGNEDGLISISQRTHRYLVEKGVPHVWHVEPGKHEFAVWKSDLYHFAQRIFR
jgi:enterochelin esterase-like enzyme